MKQRLGIILGALVALAPAAPALAQDAAKLGELERKLDILTQEIEKLKLGEAAEPQDLKGRSGMAPAASKVYESRPGKVSIGGYGETVFHGPSKRRQDAGPSNEKKQADNLRAVLYAGYKFNDWILLNSEIEFEHGGTGEGGEVRGEAAVEQAYLEFKFSRALGVRAGHVVVPLGLVNEIHEPTTFHGVDRPSVERFIIPSTWHENGVGLFGEFGPVSYRTYLMAGLNAVSSADPAADGFTASGGIRGGRTEGSNSFAEDLALASRVDIQPLTGVKAGMGLFLGEADQGRATFSVPVTLWETHAAAEWRGASLKALYAQGRIGNADALNSAQGFTDAARNSVGREFFGGYVEGAFDVLTLVRENQGQAFSPFVRYERYDTQAETPSAFSKNPANSRVEYALGATYKPIAQVAVKLDRQWKRNQARTGVDQWNLGLAYIF